MIKNTSPNKSRNLEGSKNNNNSSKANVHVVGKYLLGTLHMLFYLRFGDPSDH